MSSKFLECQRGGKSNENEIVSATNITKLLTPANVIGMWSAKMCAEKFKELVQAGKSYDEIQLIELYDKLCTLNSQM